MGTIYSSCSRLYSLIKEKKNSNLVFRPIVNGLHTEFDKKLHQYKKNIIKIKIDIGNWCNAVGNQKSTFSNQTLYINIDAVGKANLM